MQYGLKLENFAITQCILNTIFFSHFQERKYYKTVRAITAVDVWPPNSIQFVGLMESRIFHLVLQDVTKKFS